MKTRAKTRSMDRSWTPAPPCSPASPRNPRSRRTTRSRPRCAARWPATSRPTTRRTSTPPWRFVHTKSPDYDTTKAALTEQFADLDVTSELVDFDYVGHDDEFAVARVKMKTTGKPDSGFVGNTVDSMVIFHMEGGAWKLWSDKVLGVEILE